ncbi:MAG: PaaI family thioesterase [Nannocystaceae bacterium]
MAADERAEVRAELTRMTAKLFSHIPHNIALGIELLELADRTARLRLPHDPRLVGDPTTGVLHGGAITSLLDACFGGAAFMAMTKPASIATLDLRIDYLRPATPGRDVFAVGHCYRVTRSVAFVRGVAFHEREDDPIASGAATFMISADVRRGGGP